MPADATTRDRFDVVAEICSRIIAGESVASIFRTPGAGFPSIAAFWRWQFDDLDVRAAYERATEQRAEKFADEITDIADEPPPLVETQFGSHHDAAFVAWQKNRIDARKWNAARMRPKRFGDRTILAGDADNPIAVDDAKAVLARRLASTPDGSGSGGSDSGVE